MSSIRSLNPSDLEFVALKAIIALDPNAPGLHSDSQNLLRDARDSVQTALYAHLLHHLQPSEATARFGRILMLSAGAAKASSGVSAMMQLSRDLGLGVDSVIDQILLH